VFASACASNKEPSYVSGPPIQVQAHPAAMPGPKPEIEDDGQPAQVPGRRTRPEEDDPSQPWSPNYGRGKNTTERPVEQPVTRPATPRQIDAGTSVLRRAALSEADADTIVAMAISAHEARHR
jgi:hypothetical protein